MPTFCRHNHLVQNCPICSREQAIEARPVLSSSAPRSTQPRPASTGSRRRSERGGVGGPGSVRVQKLARGADDGYRSPLAPGLRSSADAERLAEELAFSTARLATLEHDPPGLYAEVARGAGDLEERTWLAFLIAYLGPVEGEDPFAEITRVRTPWADPGLPDLDGVLTGPRTAHDPSRGTRTLEAYRAWAARAGSQAAAFTGEAAWTPERRFSRAFERLALPGLHRDARFELLVSHGALRLYELKAGTLHLGGDSNVTLAAKRVFGIGDPLLLERRAADLAAAATVPIAAFDLGLLNWETGERINAGVDPDPQAQEQALSTTRAALAL